MKVFLGPRQTGNTTSMIETVATSIRRAYASNNIGDNFRVLITTPNLDVGSALAVKLIGEISHKLKVESYTKHDFKSYVVSIDDKSTIIIYVERAEDVTLTSLLEYDRVIIDDVFEHHPYDEHILIRGTYEPNK